ncbi:MAG TPA: serine/threonine-protein kinase [Polyangiaceae bacterium]|jgi:serine/threonine-protein kinase|nr:serine/threonine-protein kinase [Polyangiaceae bacterium]
MNRILPNLSLEPIELVDWDESPAGPNTASPASGDATTLCSESGVGIRDHDVAPLSEEPIWDGIPAGSLIDGKYRVLGELGRGAMGVVVLAHDETLARRVAVKLVQSHLASPGFHRRFLEEGRAMARLNHQNVVQVYACGEHGSVPYIVMELVTGSTLEKWMSHQIGYVDIAKAVSILTSVCEGLSAIHATDTLHRDIKPSNILLDEDLRPRIADLGVATVFRSRRASRPEIVGTPAYMAPEIAFPLNDEPPTHLADVYSLACVAYELLTGQLLFQGADDRESLLKHATEPVRPPSELRPGLPPAFDRVLLRALSKDPHERTPSVDEFKRDLLIASGSYDEPVRIVVAEDDDAFREVLGHGLRAEFPDAEIVCVGTGRDALEVLRERAASVAILDLNMPDLGGFEVTQTLRDNEVLQAMPIIVLTGSGGPAEWRRLLSLGADKFLVKPVSLDDLVAAVRSSVKARHSISETPSTRTPAKPPVAGTLSEIVAHESWLLPEDEL